MPRPPRLLVALVLGLAAAACSLTDPGGGADTPAARADGDAFAAALEGLERRDGLLVTHLDRAAHRLLLELPAPGERGVCAELLAVASLRRGLGSNDVGLDRGLLGSEQILELRRLGERVLFEVPNTTYHVGSDDAAQRRAAEESFARSVVFGAEVVALHEDGRALVDIGPWLLSDLMHVARALSASGQGSFTPAPERSALEFDDCHVFPRNLELEATLSFRGETPGGEVTATAPAPNTPSLVQHLTLMALPEPGFTPRRNDPRAGAFSVDRVRLDAPLGAPMRESLAVRHRLRRDPSGAPVPLVYYVDRGAPEPVRAALLDGARWWESAFAAAGWPDTYRVELLPEGVHPLDSRYHVIQWVHRRTRGWSYGRSVTDPRTGEILKAHVSLGALRVRQDILLFEGLLGAGATGSGAPDDPVQLALARIRQLSAHEVGHTLGLAHNFAASSYDDRASVMDYPPPRVLPTESGGLDVSEAYGVGIGSWDRFTIRHLYAEAPAGQLLAAAREGWLAETRAAGAVYLSDADARPAGAADPRAALWDDGPDPIADLERALEVRRRALASFGPDRVAPERPRAHLQEVLVPVVLHHRYAVDRVAKLIGGRTVDHVLAGEDAPGIRPVPAEQQRAALSALSGALSPGELELPANVLAWLSPRPPGEDAHRELFDTAAAPHVDPELIAANQARAVFGGILQPERLNRLAQDHDRDAGMLSVSELMSVLSGDAVARATEPGAEATPATRALGRVTLEQLVRGLQELAEGSRASRFVRAQAESALSSLANELSTPPAAAPATPEEAAHLSALAADITRFLDRQRTDTTPPPRSGRTPPGSPIGSPLDAWRRDAGCSLGN